MWSPARITVVRSGEIRFGLTLFEMTESVEMVYVGGSKYTPLRDLTPEQLRRFREPWQRTSIIHPNERTQPFGRGESACLRFPDRVRQRLCDYAHMPVGRPRGALGNARHQNGSEQRHCRHQCDAREARLVTCGPTWREVPIPAFKHPSSRRRFATRQARNMLRIQVPLHTGNRLRHGFDGTSKTEPRPEGAKRPGAA